ncbi:MAG: ArnT family glycosyltransferase [Limisphaerales bacterium]
MITFKREHLTDETNIRLVEPAGRPIAQVWAWLVVLLVMVLTSFIRYRLIDLPLERDEGEYACAGQMLLHGIAPYQLGWNMTFPGTYLAYTLGMAAFGQTAAGIHATLIVVNCLTIVLLFLLGQRLFGTTAGLAACAAYGVLSVSPAILGLAAHADDFVLLFALWGALVLWKAEEFYRWHAMFFSGLFFGLALLMGEQGIGFCLFAPAILVWHGIQTGALFKPVLFRKLFFLGAGILLPVLLVCFYLNQTGLLPKFLFWTKYAGSYAAENTARDGLHNFLQDDHKKWAICFPYLGFLLVSLPFVMRDRALRSQIIFAVAFLFFSALGTPVDFDFREHYFILILPALAILIGLAIVSLQFATSNRVFKVVPSVVCILILGWSLFQQRQFFFQLPPTAVSRILYDGDTPMADMPAVGNYIRAHSGPVASMAVIGSDPELYFYAQRRPATGYLCTYPLMERQPYASQMQAEMVSQIQTNKPEFLVFVSNPDSWHIQPGSDRSIFNWFTRYSGASYERVALLDQISPNKTVFVTGDRLKNYHPDGRNYIGVFRRKAGI